MDAPGEAADYFVLHVPPPNGTNVWGRNVCGSLYVNKGMGGMGVAQ
jgi:hypothetical protein